MLKSDMVVITPQEIGKRYEFDKLFSLTYVMKCLLINGICDRKICIFNTGEKDDNPYFEKNICLIVLHDNNCPNYKGDGRCNGVNQECGLIPCSKGRVYCRAECNRVRKLRGYDT